MVVLSGGIAPVAVVTPATGVFLRSGLACITGVLLADVLITSSTLINASSTSVVDVSPADAVNTATLNEILPCAAISTARRLMREQNGDLRRLAGSQTSITMASLTVSVRVSSYASSPEGSASVVEILSRINSVINASATNFSSGVNHSSTCSLGCTIVASAFGPFVSAAVNAGGLNPAAITVGVSAQTTRVTMASQSTTQTPRASFVAAASAAEILSTPAIIGISFGCCVAFIGVVAIAVFVTRRKALVHPTVKNALPTPPPPVLQHRPSSYTDPVHRTNSVEP